MGALTGTDWIRVSTVRLAHVPGLLGFWLEMKRAATLVAALGGNAHLIRTSDSKMRAHHRSRYWIPVAVGKGRIGVTLAASCPLVYDISAAFWEGKLHPSFFALEINGETGT